MMTTIHDFLLSRILTLLRYHVSVNLAFISALILSVNIFPIQSAGAFSFPKQLSQIHFRNNSREWNQIPASNPSVLRAVDQKIHDLELFHEKPMSSTGLSFFSLLPQHNEEIPLSRTTADSWKRLCPPLWNAKESRDVTVVWSSSDISSLPSHTNCEDDETERVARELLRRVTGSDTNTFPPKKLDPYQVRTLAQSLKDFQGFCRKYILADSDLVTDSRTITLKFKARLVATRGKRGGKCPQWHIYHVPVRWIQTLTGPGCEVVVGKNGIRRDLFFQDTTDDGLEEDLEDDHDNEAVEISSEDRNRQLVDESVANVYKAKEEEALLLLGKRWKELHLSISTDDWSNIRHNTILPAVHKSPSVPWGCERVLLTQDVIIEDDALVAPQKNI